jgi:hypothetical protein
VQAKEKVDPSVEFQNAASVGVIPETVAFRITEAFTYELSEGLFIVTVATVIEANNNNRKIFLKLSTNLTTDWDLKAFWNSKISM